MPSNHVVTQGLVVDMNFPSRLLTNNGALQFPQHDEPCDDEYGLHRRGDLNLEEKPTPFINLADATRHGHAPYIWKMNRNGCESNNV